MLVKCPNCEHEFIVDKEQIVGECPKCRIKLAFSKGNEKIEKVNIRKIEEEIDRIPSIIKKADIEIEEIGGNEGIEEMVDKIIG